MGPSPARLAIDAAGKESTIQMGQRAHIFSAGAAFWLGIGGPFADIQSFSAHG
jgi:hypothetical protein